MCFLLIASRGTNQITSIRIKLAHKEQSQARPCTSEAPPKQHLEDQAKTHSYTLRNIVKTKHQPVEFMGEKTKYFLLSSNSEMPSSWTKKDVNIIIIIILIV